ncbi:MAG: CaiB/BaiF CoA transferase family protein [Chloroflexota bacterium]
MSNSPLQGIRVLDLTRVLAGPYCTMLLGDYGADVIKVEAPGRGDDTRQWGPPWAGGESAYYLSVNRNKRSITVNLKHADGVAIIRRLLEESDVLVENFEVGGMACFGLDFERVHAVNPRLVYCSITGYGQDGPYRDRPGYDFVIQAEGGIMSITGEPEGPPMKVGVAIADIMAGMFACNAILVALHHRETTGEGQFIDISLFDSQLGWLANVAQNYLVSREAPKRYGNAHANIVPYQAFATKDGWLAVGIGNDAQFRRFCEVAGCDEIWAEARFQTNPGRVQHRAELVARLEAVFHQRGSEEWLGLLEQAGVPHAPINSIPQALAHPQASARGMVQSVPHPTAGEIQLVRPVAKFSASAAHIQRHPPLLGEHTREVLQSLGYEDVEIERLRRGGAI